jgi:hypothetical protein
MNMRWYMTAAAGLLCLGTQISAKTPASDGAPTGFRITKDDTIVHKASKTRFPLHLAGFTRVLEKPFDLAGHNVVVAYSQTINGQPVLARIALIQIVGMTPKEHYLGIKSMVGSYVQGLSFTNVKPQGEGPFTLPGMKPESGYQGRFKAMQKGHPYELSLSTVRLGKWDVRLTAAYPAATALAARANIQALVTALRQTGPAHL